MRPLLDAVRRWGIAELAQRLLNAARRVTASEAEAEELVRDGFARCCAPQRQGRRKTDTPSEIPARSETAPGTTDDQGEAEVSTTYSREFEDIITRCGRHRGQRSEDDERRINSFVCRLTLTTHRHFLRKQGQSAALAVELAQHQYAILESIEDELIEWSEHEDAITRVLDAILTEIARRGDTPLGNALKDRLRNALADADECTTSDDIAARHGVPASTLRSSWYYLMMFLKRNQRC